jgi:cytochrome c peroxidase
MNLISDPRPWLATLAIGVALSLLAVGCQDSAGGSTSTTIAARAPGLTQIEDLGKRIFNDNRLSEPLGMSCATCHDPGRAFSGNNGSGVGVARGVTGALGIRNTPTVMYASYSPHFAVVLGEEGEGLAPTGGQFLDGRADTLAQQALLPLLSATEMNNPDSATVVAKIQSGSYAAEFQAEFGADIFTRPDDAFNALGTAVQAYEQSAELHPFSSRYDDYLRGNDTFTDAEHRGMALFFSPVKGNCAICHAANPYSAVPQDSLFTDFTYENLGVPRNPMIPANADPGFFDLGLGGPKRALPYGNPAFNGMFKIPTLRNAAVKEAFFHNGRFTTLEELVDFYSTRDTDPSRWYSGVPFDDLPASARTNVNTVQVPYDRQVGQEPRLNPAERSDLIAFLRTLTDEPFIGLLPPPTSSN